MSYEKLDELKIRLNQNREDFKKMRDKYLIEEREQLEKNSNEDFLLVFKEIFRSNIAEHKILTLYIEELEKTHPHFMKKNKNLI